MRPLALRVRQMAVPIAKADPSRAAGLTYVSDLEPGIRRKKTGTGFSYWSPAGHLISNKAVLNRIRRLAVPPAWADVWICPQADGHVQATGRDAKGRKQYRYHDDWRQVRDRDKFDRLIDFAKLLARIRQRVDEDMRKRGAPREKVLATVVNLLDKSLIRVGNGEYAKDNKSYGLTTLRTSHVDIAGSELRFHFKGKSGKIWRLKIKDRRIARVVRSIQDLPGQNLFQYVDDDGEVRTIRSTDVNDYLREIAGANVSAKDFRTWAGTVLAALALSATGPFSSQAQAKLNVRRAIEAVAARLGNTATICRKCYVHPDVVLCYLEGRLPIVRAGDGVSSSGLPREEAAVLRMLTRQAARAASKRLTSNRVKIAA
jgi:DNA topoisomerase I